MLYFKDLWYFFIDLRLLILKVFGNSSFSTSNIIGNFLNGEYLNDSKYLTGDQVNMIEDNTTWYLGTVGNSASYKLAKYTDINMSGYAANTDAKVGLLRLGELMAGQFNIYDNNIKYWTLTQSGPSHINYVNNDSSILTYFQSVAIGVKTALNLKSNVIITSGDGTLQNPFTIELSS